MSRSPGFVGLIAKERGVSIRTVERWCVSGKVPGAYRIQGGHWRGRKPRRKRYTPTSPPPRLPLAPTMIGWGPWIKECLDWSYISPSPPLPPRAPPLTIIEWLTWIKQLLAWHIEVEMEQLTASQEFNDALEYSHVAHGISQDDRCEITHRAPKERWHLTMQLKDRDPEKFRYLLQTPMHELISERAYDAIRERHGMLMVKAKNLGPNMTSASLARELKISVATLYRPPYGRDAVKRARDYAHGAPVRDEVSIDVALSDKGHHLL